MRALGESRRVIVEIPELKEIIDKLNEFEKRLNRLDGQDKRTNKYFRNDWLAIKETATALNVSVRTVRRLLKWGLIKRNLAIWTVRIHKDQLEEYRRKTSN
jgi:hypothetical protein